MALTREQILAARSHRKPIRLEVPEWGGEVFIRVLSVEQQMQWEDVPDKEMVMRVLTAALVNEDGAPIFEPDDWRELAKEDFPVIMRVFDEVAQVNGLTSKELDEAMALFASAPVEPSVSG